MRIRCLVIDKNPEFKSIIESIMGEIPSSQVTTVTTSQAANQTITSSHFNVIFLSYNDPAISPPSIFSLLQQSSLRSVVIPVVDKPTAPLLKSLLNQTFVIDVLTRPADPQRIRGAIQKAIDHLFSSKESPSYYRGFVGFIGVTPSLQQRKMLQTARLGIIHNRSIRLAIEYWRKNPNSQLIAIILNANYKFTTRIDESIENWEGQDFKPWEISMFEAQNHYLQYWQDPIRDGHLRQIIPTLIQRNADSIDVLDPEYQMETLIKLGKIAQKGELDTIFKSMGISFQIQNDFVGRPSFKVFVESLEKTMETVDKKYPHLTHPPEETGYENWKPDVATPYQDASRRMVYIEKKTNS